MLNNSLCVCILFGWNCKTFHNNMTTPCEKNKDILKKVDNDLKPCAEFIDKITKLLEFYELINN